ncbi:hypothetical protein [Flagellimonas sp. S3867]|uniref:hypothetical protein n=1 Tax=Flagellimonas sp. S3867 TaxID=2768063 RepID=UPI001682A0DE|nr:hypothetical protein [Flagellimonas sp. S3867]
MKLLYSKILFTIFTTTAIVTSCSTDKNTPISPKLIFKFKFDPDQERLGNFGEPQSIPEGHAAQTPTFNLMGAHYIELAKKNDIPAYNGTLVYESPVTSKGGSEAIDFDQALYASDGEIFYETDLRSIESGTYQYLRISLSYQNYDIAFRAQNLGFTGTIASFVGANTYIESFEVKNQAVAVNGNKLQGYWAFEADIPRISVLEGQAPPNATTVPNPISEFSPIPPGSCLVTGSFITPFEITGNETEDVVIICSISVNNSFEWVDGNANGSFEPTEGDVVVDMGVRGLVPIVEQ